MWSNVLGHYGTNLTYSWTRVFQIITHVNSCQLIDKIQGEQRWILVNLLLIRAESQWQVVQLGIQIVPSFIHTRQRDDRLLEGMGQTKNTVHRCWRSCSTKEMFGLTATIDVHRLCERDASCRASSSTSLISRWRQKPNLPESRRWFSEWNDELTKKLWKRIWKKVCGSSVWFAIFPSK